jgi:ubiquinone/menaquinone biosynthesis C-methylase UbiE
VLEVGFGSGVSFLNLSQLYQEIYGLDLTADTRKVGEMFANLGIQTDLRNGSLLELPYPDQSFDAVLLISILEHLQPYEQLQAFREIWRVLKPGGQVVYGVPVERPFMAFMFRLLGTNIREHHFSTETDVRCAATQVFGAGKITSMRGPLGLFGKVYEVGEYEKTDSFQTSSNL